MTEKPTLTALEKELAVGNVFTFNGERQVVCSWHSNGGDRFILASPLGKPHAVIRHMWTDLERERNEGRI